MSSFLFGWHVHEKAILMPLFCMSWLCWVEKNNTTMDWIILQMIAMSCMFPLIFGCLERIAILGWILWIFCAILWWLKTSHTIQQRIPWFATSILGICIGLPWWIHHTKTWLSKYEFLPWMLLSGYGGMITLWVYWRVTKSMFD